MKFSPQFNTLISEVDGSEIRFVKMGFKENTSQVLIFLPGRGEWIEKYMFLYEDLCKVRGWGFISLDHRGQGASGGKAAHVETYDHFASDLKQLVKQELDGRTYTILGHSMGGLISLYTACKYDLKPDKMVLSSPLLGMPQQPIPRIFAKPFAYKMCDLGLSKNDTLFGRHENIPFILNKLTTDKQKFKIIQNNPYKIPGPTFGWIKASFLATEYIFHDSHIARLNFPIKVFLGSREMVVDPRSIVKWTNVAKKISDHKVEMVRIADAKHELLFEREECYNRIKIETNRFFDQ